jgi:hypothetical protein
LSGCLVYKKRDKTSTHRAVEASDEASDMQYLGS